jgi:hypothetical protein
VTVCKVQEEWLLSGQTVVSLPDLFPNGALSSQAFPALLKHFLFFTQVDKLI